MEADPAMRSAIQLLRSSTRLRRDGGHVLMMRSLRQMDDPALVPVFKSWADSGQPALQVHGILGLAQNAPQHRLDVDRVLAIDNPAVQAQLMVAAIDGDLLGTDQARAFLHHPDLNPGVKLLPALYLVQEEQPVEPAVLDEIAAAPVEDHLVLVPMIALKKQRWTVDQVTGLELEVRRALVSLIKLQLGDAQAVDQLNALDQHLPPPVHDPVLQLLLATVVRSELARTEAWAGRFMTAPTVNEAIKMLSLQAGLRFDWPGAPGAWQRWYDSPPDATDPSGLLAHRLRLALVALRTARWQNPGLFETLMNEQDPLLRSIGYAGRAIASREGVGEAVRQLTTFNHPTINPWAIAFAKNRCQPEDARVILSGLITARDPSKQSASQWLNQVAAATEGLCDLDPDAAVEQLRPILQSPQTDDRLIQGVLYGLVRSSRDSQPHRVIESLGPFADPDAAQLALVVTAKSGQSLSAQQQADLKLIVRGGGGMQDPLRIQAAWAYLRLTDRTGLAIERALGG